MIVTVQVKPDVPGDIQEHLAEAVASFGGTLKAMAPGAQDPAMARYFTFEVPDAAAAARASAALLQHAAVAAAYVKPADALP